MDKYLDCAYAPTLNRLRRELGRVISYYPYRNHNGITTIIALPFMTFSTFWGTYLKFFEAGGLYILYYSTSSVSSTQCKWLVVILFTIAQLLDAARTPFLESRSWRLDMYTNVFTDDQPSVVAYGNWGIADENAMHNSYMLESQHVRVSFP
ncbi:hypothetical protein M9H77_02426 [Catharanthus roseus]|uniref:Uncharacterized protein n=1 Tax=Catharanthus roseus TaxID=4058 RepID=A0ACC0C8C8_CATRO|nr:hypothetical protein M9H77_02426 [Catharanthus roseus]